MRSRQVITWYTEVCEIGQKYGSQVEDAKNMRKSEWKKRVKCCINESMEKEFEKKKHDMIKLRFVNMRRDMAGYLRGVDSSIARDIMKIRLNMWNLRGNTGKSGSCRLCDKESESTQHLFNCTKMGHNMKIDLAEDRKIRMWEGAVTSAKEFSVELAQIEEIINTY